ncbi:MAG TPA: nucleoside diphosphate kinase regulator [Spirochaetota bacterium]|mgnify:CR=1 FL=1|nr:nucleoside diphosphate kinase regulator [Spirochaetota bacterium]
MNKKRIILNSRDFIKLKQVINESIASGHVNAKNLDAELSNALLLEPEKIPSDVITMNTRVSFIDINEAEEFVYTIVYPEDADLANGKLSVLAPIGTALLGYKEGDEIVWNVPAGQKILHVEKILYQPEANGDYYQ